MKTLERKQLLEYLKHAIELESSLVAQEQIMDAYEQSSNSRKPVLYLENQPSAPTLKTAETSEGEAVSWVIGLIVGGFGLLALICFLLGNTAAFASPVGWFLSVIPLAIGAYMVFKPSLDSKRRDEEYRRRYDYEWSAYKDKCRAIDSKNEEIRKQYNMNYSDWQSSNDKIYGFLKRRGKETYNILMRLYEKDVVFPKYRNLPALTSIYEYLLSGRCDELTGPNGAYNLYEDELRKNIIVSQLNTIIANLEQIRNNQYMLYEEIKKVQKNTRIIANELYAIKGYTAELTMLTALNTYYNGIAAGNSHIMAYWR